MSVTDRAETGGDTCQTGYDAQTKAGYHAQIKAENRARIIRAARDLFLARGYDKTSLAQIAREARVSTGTLFKRYPSRPRCSRPSPPSSGSWTWSTPHRPRPAIPATGWTTSAATTPAWSRVRARRRCAA